LIVACHECGAELKFADADEGAEARCRHCRATIVVKRKATSFQAAKPAKKKKTRKPVLDPAARLTDGDKQEAIRAGESGARLMLAALLANFLAFAILALIAINFILPIDVSRIVGSPRVALSVLGLFSNACLLAAMFRWRKSAAAVERGQVVQIGMVLGSVLFAVELARTCGLRLELVDWLATYGRMVYFTLLVVYVERICVLASRTDLLDLTHRVLSCGVGVIGIAMIQQFVVFTGFFLFLPFMPMLSAVMVITWIVWSVEYFRLLMYASSMRER
jgi:DNA-directed RNA polymerase subunit RPC12/RpoP